METDYFVLIITLMIIIMIIIINFVFDILWLKKLLRFGLLLLWQVGLVAVEAEDCALIMIFLAIVIINLNIFDILRLKKKAVKDKLEEEGPSVDEEEASTSKDTSAPERCVLSQDKSSTEIKLSEQKPMEAQELEGLHLAIKDGDFETVKRAVESHGRERFFSFKDTSALFKAFKCKKYDIISFLIHRGSKIHEYEVYDLCNLEVDLQWLNYLLLDYNKKSVKSCIYRLISLSQSPQELDAEKMDALKLMYEWFFQSDIIKLLMNVLEGERFDIVYDFRSDKVNRMHRHYVVESDIYGLTLTNSKEIFIGAKNLLSHDPHKRKVVYGVVAEELCHLAMETLFLNGAKPYKIEDSNLVKEFKEIVKAVESLIAHSFLVESVIQDVFKYYNADSRECELIARVPHIIGIYGEDEGRRVFQGSPELYRLLEFYEQHVHPKCKLYVDPSMNTKRHQEMELLIQKNDFITLKEKQLNPLKKNFKSFRTYLVKYNTVSVITTNCTRLCMLHVYHELKEKHGCLIDKKCLFFTRKFFEKNVYKLQDTLKGNVWKYLILVMDKRELNLRRFQAEYLDHLEPAISGSDMELIMISSTQSTDQKFDFRKAVNYKWSDLREKYKTTRQCIKYLFKGEEEVTYVGKECFPKVFNDDDICMLLSGELIEVDDGCDLFSQGYLADTFIQREFHSTVVDDKIFKNLSSNTNVLLSGLKKDELKALPLNKDAVQWLQGSDDEIKRDKSVFVVNEARPMTFEDFTKKTHKKNHIWLHYNEKEFYVRSFLSSDDVFGCYLKQKILGEEEILKFLKRKQTVIISDNAGYGKSTVISNLIDIVKRSDFRSWNKRINFNIFSGNKSDPLSIANVRGKRSNEEVLNQLFLMLGLKNGLEKHLFREFSKEGHCFLFFDGFDEIPSELKNCALKLLSTVRKETAVNMIVSTRKHHQEELEQLLNTYSHQLVPLSREDQVRYLVKLWINKLKYPYGRGTLASHNDKQKVVEKIKNIIKQSEDENTKVGEELKDLIIEFKKIDLGDDLVEVRSKLDDLNFRKLAEHVIDKTQLDKEILQFMGIPLHLFMIGIIYHDSNFNVKIQSNIYSIYSDFIEQKVLIYVEEKQRILHDGIEKKTVLERDRRNAYRIHIELANQLMDAGKLDSNMNKEDLELCTALGIAFVSGGKVDFLHFTFAEFFKAESIRVNFSKTVAIEALFDDKYNVVRRFLSSSLEKKSFENLTREFFEDVDFLFNILEEFVRKFLSSYNNFYNYTSNLHASTIVKIVKYLLEMFERSVDEDLLIEFVVKLETKLSSLRDWYCVGGCLTVKMIKVLMNRNMNSKVIFGAVKYYTNPEEVIEVLRECISIETNTKSHSNERKNGGNVKSKRLLKLLQTKDSKGMSLLIWAICNVRSEIFVKTLKFFKDVTEKEEFKASFPKKEYGRAIDGFIRNVDYNRINGLMKEFHSVFGDEVETFFGIDLKFRILQRTLHIIDESNNAFEEAINLLKECFGLKKLKEVLLICGSDGNCLIFRVVFQNRNVIKHLNIIKNILDDKIKMKQVLKSKDSMFRNMFHLAAENKNMDFGDLLQFCNENLEKDEIKEMLMSADKDGVNVLHLLFKINSSERLIKDLNVIRNMLADDNLFKKFLMTSDGKSNNIFHFAGLNRNEISISFLDSHLSKIKIRDFLIERNDTGMTCLHSGSYFDSTNLPVFLNYSYEILKSYKDYFERLVLAKDENGNSFLHVFTEKYYVYGKEEVNFVRKIIQSLKEKLSDDNFRKLLWLRNKKKETFLQIKIKEKTIEFYEGILEKNLFRELLQSNENA